MVDSFSNPSTLDVLSPVDVAQIFHSLRDYVAIQEPLLDEFGAVVDTRLIWWNNHYQTIRLLPVEAGQRISDTYFEPHVALEYVNKAWTAGHALQIFELTPDKRDRYRAPGSSVVLSIDWQRVGNYIVEVGSDLTEYRALQLQLADQRSLAFVANRDRALLAERERIARNLHDSVIQGIYAASLGLSAIAASEESARRTTTADTRGAEKSRTDGAGIPERIRLIADQLSDLIKSIRDEIFDVSHDPAGSLQRDLEAVLVPILAPTPIELSLDVAVREIDDRPIMTHLRAVVREAVSNSVRHAHCSRISLAVRRIANDQLEVTIADNGVGIPGNTDRRSGLANIEERAHELGGFSRIERADLGGTLLRWTIPLPVGAVVD